MAKLNIGEVVKGAEQLSLGISIVVAVAIGTGLGFWLKSVTGWTWAIFAGLALGIAAAVLNVKKAYAKILAVRVHEILRGKGAKFWF